MLNPFSADGFSLTGLSQAIDILPNTYGRILLSGLFKWVPQTQPSVVIEMRNNVLHLLPTAAYGAPAPKNVTGKRFMRTFLIPHTPIEDNILAAEVMGIRAFGTEDTAETVTNKMNEKLQTMKSKMDITMEYRQMGALKGVVYDADGTTVIYDYFAEFGVTQKVVDFELSDANTNVREKCMELLRYLEDNLLGETMTGCRILVSSEFMDDLVKHPSVEAIWAGWQAAAERLGGDPRKGFEIAGVTFEEYRGSVDSIRFIAEGEGHVIVEGTMDTYRDYGAPADFIETVNTLAQAYYARQEPLPMNRGTAVHAQSNRLPLVCRPRLSVKVTA